MVWSFRAIGRVPSKKNSRITSRKTGRSFPSAAYVKWHKDTSKQLSVRPSKTFGECEVQVIIFFPDVRRADVTNKAESVLDWLQDVGIIQDDSWTMIGAPILGCDLDRANPGFFVRINDKV